MLEPEMEIVVLGGGVSAERAVSLASAQAVFDALQRGGRKARFVDLTVAALPEAIDVKRDVIFPVLHGTFGEDGGIQTLLEASGFSYVGSDADSSRLCMDKGSAKAIAAEAGVPVLESLYFDRLNIPRWAAVCEQLGATEVVLKPRCEGSSVGLHLIASPEEWERVGADLGPGEWMVERRLRGHDVTVGILEGAALGVVEIFPGGDGVYDYERKYSKGETRYRAPAQIDQGLERAMKTAAEAVFKGCGCRDFARIDFYLEADGSYWFLEINTIPGLTSTSLLPKSAGCLGLDFANLVDRMIEPACYRLQSFRQR